MSWIELETSTYQHHVISHVIGATVLGWFIAGDAVHFVLDIGLLWTIYVNAEMDLMALSVAIDDLESEELSRSVISELLNDAQLLVEQGTDAPGLKHFTAASVDCLVADVRLFGNEAARRVVVTGEVGTIEIRTSLEDLSVRVSESSSTNVRSPG